MSIEQDEADRSIVVGVDGSERNRAAVAWAAELAAATGRPLDLLAVLDDYDFPLPHHRPSADDEIEWSVLNRLAHEVTAEHPGLTVRRRVEPGGSVKGLVDHADDQHLLVVGKRGLGAFARILAGSTSIGVAGRAQVPVVVVPDTWDPGSATGDVLVGVAVDETQTPALRFAFTAAQRHGAGVRVVHAVDPHPQLTWEPVVAEVVFRELDEDRTDELETLAGPLLEEFPDVPVEITSARGNPGNVLLDEGATSRLVVLGRRRSGVLGGFPLGSVARGVLHHAEVPVAVVPNE